MQQEIVLQTQENNSAFSVVVSNENAKRSNELCAQDLDVKKASKSEMDSRPQVTKKPLSTPDCINNGKKGANHKNNVLFVIDSETVDKVRLPDHKGSDVLCMYNLPINSETVNIARPSDPKVPIEPSQGNPVSLSATNHQGF